ncbi:WD40 repeat-like protein [Mycena sanguinolenta]|nr:WD40 repeat-like protein [Mycena sanguinolenta]
MAESYPVLRMTSDEINCLIYAFLVDSGFKHTAFSLAMEGRLENSPHFAKHIPRGELVDLLSKSLLYQEVECHWKADHLALNCKAEFTLLQPHVCSLEPPKQTSIWLQPAHVRWPLQQSNRANGVTVPDGKRKASPSLGADEPAEKRIRRESDDIDVMDVDFPPVELPNRGRQQGPGDNETNPDAINVLSGHEAEVFVCAFNPTKQSILVTGSKDAGLNLWDLPYPPAITSPGFARPPGPPRRLEYFGNVDQGDLTALHWNAEGTLIAIGSYDSVVRVCTVSGELYFSQHQHQGPILAVRFSRDGRWLVTASLDGTACLWDVHAKELKTQYRAHSGCCLDVDWVSDTLFATCSADHFIHLMDIAKADPVKTFSGHTNEINEIECNPSGTHLASCSDDMTARIWKVGDISASGVSSSESNEPVVLIGHKHSVTLVGWCPNTSPGTNEIVATASWEGVARLWDSVTGECLHIFEDHKLPIYTIKFSPTGRWVATGSSDGWLHVYDVKAGKITWSWFAGVEKPAVYHIDWQTGDDNLDRIALALESWQIAVIDVSRVPALQAK